MTLASIGNPRYIALETYRKSGESVITPVWTAAENGKLYALTQRSTGKVKRIQANSHIRVCACDLRGEPRGAWVEATAAVLDSREAIDHAVKILMRKYWIQYPLLNLISNDMRPTSDVVVIQVESDHF